MDNSISQSERATRQKKGVPPVRYGFEPDVRRPAHSESSVAGKTTSYRSSRKSLSSCASARKVLQAEMQVAQLELRMAKLDAESQQRGRGSSPQMADEVFQEADRHSLPPDNKNGESVSMSANTLDITNQSNASLDVVHVDDASTCTFNLTHAPMQDSTVQTAALWRVYDEDHTRSLCQDSEKEATGASVVPGVGVSDFDPLYSGEHNDSSVADNETVDAFLVKHRNDCRQDQLRSPVQDNREQRQRDSERLQQLRSWQEEIWRVRAENDQLQQANRLYRQQLSAKSRENESLLTALDSLRSELAVAERRSTQAQVERDQLIHEHQRQHNSQANIIARLEREAATTASLRDTLRTVTASAETAKQEAADWRTLFLQESTRSTSEPAKGPANSANEQVQRWCTTAEDCHGYEDCEEYVSETVESPPPTTCPEYDQAVHTDVRAGVPTVHYKVDKSMGEVAQSVQAAPQPPVQTPTIAHVASEFVGALTSALRADRGGNNSDLRQLTARQSKVNTVLPSFSGQPEDWPAFISIFQHSTRQCGFNEAENAQRLRNALKGPAKDAVMLMLSVPGNVDKAISTLERRFGRPDLVVADLISKAKAMKALKADDLNGLVDYTTAVNNIVATMQLLDCNGHMTNPSLRQELLDKLPTALRVQWGEHINTNSLSSATLTLDVLAKWLTTRAEAAALVAPIRPIEPQRKSNTTTLYGTPATERPPGPKLKCSHCSGEHFISTCSSFRQLHVKKKWDVVRRLELCHRCLRAGHWRSECHSNTSCTKCPSSHHTLLHTENPPQGQSTSRSRQQQTSSTHQQSTAAKGQTNTAVQHESTVTNLITTAGRPSNTLLVARDTNDYNKPRSTVSFMAVPVLLQSKNGQIRANALLDGASSTSYIRSDIADELELDGTTEMVETTVLGGNIVSSQQRQVTVNILSDDGSFTADVKAWTQSTITAPQTVADWSAMKVNYPHLCKIPFPSLASNEVDMLIGVDLAPAHTVLQEVTGQEGEPFARRGPLGWVCYGNIQYHKPATSPMQTLCATLADQRLDKVVARFWDTEEVGMEDPSTLTAAEEEAMQTTKEATHMSGSRVETAIPWVNADQAPHIQPNRAMAERRLMSLERSLSKRPAVAQEYSRVIANHLQKGYISLCEPDVNEENQSWYLPHFPVVRTGAETTKVRVVFDAAAEDKGKSLNSEMFAGPKLQQDLTPVLLRFCAEPVPLVADVAEMFLQVSVRERDRQYLRFLWRTAPDEEVKIYQFNRLVFGLKASPYLACNALHYVVDTFGSQVSDLARHLAKKDFYVDDLLGSAPNDSKAIAVRQELQQLLAEGSFHLRKWRSNSKAVLGTIPPEDRADNAMLCLEPKSDPAGASTVKTLGVAWDARTDTFTFVYQEPKEQRLTKRAVLSKMASVYDPRGQISPFTIRAGVAFQELCLAGNTWDEPLTADQEAKWTHWFKELPALSKIQANRCFKDPDRPSADAQTELHTFVDASQHAIAAVVYTRAVYPDGHVRTTLAFARAKTGPTKKTTIPKMELKGAVLGVRVASMVAKALDIPADRQHFWSDSMNVVYWVRSHLKNFTSDVASKIAEIQANTNGKQWRHVPGTLNPADRGTRGTSADSIATDKLWWQGPDFLVQGEQQWPTTVLATCRELPGQLKKVQATTFVTSTDESLLSIGKYSSWHKLLRVTARCLQFIAALKHRVHRGEGQTEAKLRDQEANRAAERYWVWKAQVDSFRTTFQQLEKSDQVAPSDPLYRLQPTLDTSAMPAVLVMSGRLQHGQHLEERVRRPMILPKRHKVTTLLIEAEDDACQHAAGPHHLLANLRQRFWIVDGLTVVKAIQAQCITCRKLWSKPAEQLMGPLPSYRTATSLKPFSRVGVDFAGPFETKQGRGKVRAKRYLCLFTCLEVRACHLEMAYGLDTDAFLMALTRFIKRRGVPELIVSDNDTNFTSAEKLLREAVKEWDQKKIQRAFVQQNVKWKFSPARAPHFGGVFETMIKAAKRAITHAARNAALTDEELLTTFAEAENLLNTRPLTSVSTDPDDLQPLTPHHFLVGRLDAPLPLEVCAEEESTPHPRKRWLVVQQVISQFWERWRKECIPLLNIRKSWHRTKPNLCIGDVVLVIEDNAPRGLWPMGRITETFPGADGLVRVVDVRMGKKVKRRPIHRLVPLLTAEDK